MAEYENVLLPEDAVQFINSMYIMAILNQEGRYVYVNPGWFEHNKVIREPGKPPVSLEPSDILGKKVWDVVPDSKAAYVLEHGVPIVGEPVEGGNTFTTYLPRYTQDGQPNGCYLYHYRQSGRGRRSGQAPFRRHPGVGLLQAGTGP